MNPNVTTAINQPTTAPGLAIHGASSPLAKFNTFKFKANGQFFGAAGADAPSLALATRLRPAPNGVPVVAGNLNFDDGTVPVSTNSCRMYTLIATLPFAENPTVTFSWIAGEDFPKHRQATSGDVAQPVASNQVAVGYLYVKNESSAVFVPGTTNLDATNITATYSDNYAQVGA